MKNERFPINRKIKLRVGFTLLICLFISSLKAKQIENNVNTVKDTTHIRVGISGSEPFIVRDQQELTGISYEIWQNVSDMEDWKFTTQSYGQVSDALTALKKNEIDILVGPISITSIRAENFQFSQPYFQSSLSILARKDTINLWGRIQPFFSTKLLYAILVFLFILGCVGTLLWISERKASPDQFPPEPGRGIANGMWCAIVTMSTTGYGDIAPVTLAGRIIAASWMVISLIFAGTMIAGISSTLTLTGMDSKIISTAEELTNKKVAVLEGAPAVQFVKSHGAEEVPVENIDAAYKLLKNKQVDAMVFDRPILQYFFTTHPDKEVVISNAQYLKQGYGFVFPLNSEKFHEINIDLLKLKENGKLDDIVQEWLGKKEI